MSSRLNFSVYFNPFHEDGHKETKDKLEECCTMDDSALPELCNENNVTNAVKELNLTLALLKKTMKIIKICYRVLIMKIVTLQVILL